MRPDTLKSILERLAAAGYFPHIHPRLLRHTAATLISEEGYNEVVIAALLGHSKGKGVTRGQGARVTRRYIHAHDKVKREAILSLETRLLEALSEPLQEVE
jgi:integrase